MKPESICFAVLFLCCVLAGSHGGMALAGDRVRHGPTAAERAAFAHFVGAEFAGARTVGAGLEMRGEVGKRGARVAGGLIELPAVRRSAMLCKAARLELEGGAAWRVTQRYDVAWLNPAGCAARGGKVRLGAGVPDGDAVKLLGQYGQLLARARLLVAGDSRCAQERSSRFFLVGIDEASGMARLSFASDRPVRLSVYAKPNGIDYDVWKIDCRR